jgi:hypothetical protein
MLKTSKNLITVEELSNKQYEKLNAFIEENNKHNKLWDLSHKYYDIVIYNKQEKPETRFKPLKNDFVKYVAKNDQYGFTLYLLLLLEESKQFDTLYLYYSSNKADKKRILVQDIQKIQVLSENQKQYIKNILPEKYFGKELLYSFEIFNYVFNKQYEINNTHNKVEEEKAEQRRTFFSFLIDTSELGILTNWKNHVDNNIDSDSNFNKNARFSTNCINIMEILDKYDKYNVSNIDYTSLPKNFKFNNGFEFLCKYFSLAYLQDYILFFTREKFSIVDFENYVKKDKYLMLLKQIDVPSLDKDIINYIQKLDYDLKNHPELLSVWTFDELTKYEQKNNAVFISDELINLIEVDKKSEDTKQNNNFEIDLDI